MSETTLEVPSHLAEKFDKVLKRRIGAYAENAKTGAEFWEKNPDRSGDLDDAVNLLNAAMAVERREMDGKVTYSGSAWVLSDTADDTLRLLTDEIQNRAFHAPLPYEEVATLAAHLEEWALVCDRIDSTYREGVA